MLDKEGSAYTSEKLETAKQIIQAHKIAFDTSWQS